MVRTRKSRGSIWASASLFEDFGRGFYLTSLDGQAFDMANRTCALQNRGRPVVTVFELSDSWRDSGLSIREISLLDRIGYLYERR